MEINLEGKRVDEKPEKRWTDGIESDMEIAGLNDRELLKIKIYGYVEPICISDVVSKLNTNLLEIKR